MQEEMETQEQLILEVEVELEPVVQELLVEMVVLELLLLDTNFKINMYLLNLKINI